MTLIMDRTRWIAAVLLIALLLLCRGHAATADNDSCTNFYTRICMAPEDDDATLTARNQSTSHFRALNRQHRAYTDAWLQASSFYGACMHQEASQRAATLPGEHTALTPLRAGWTHPLSVHVVPSLAGPAFVVDLGLEPALYGWYAAVRESGQQQPQEAPPAWTQHVYESRAFQHWLHDMVDAAGTEEENKNEEEEEQEQESRQDALAGLVDYVRAYEPYSEVRRHLAKRAAALLDQLLDYHHQPDQELWVHRNGMPHAVLESLLLASVEHGEAMARDLSTLTVQLLEAAPPRGYLYHAAWLESGVPPALRTHFRQRHLLRQLTYTPGTTTAAATAAADTKPERTTLCTRLARVVYMAPLNRAFFEDGGAGMQARCDAAALLVRAIRVRLRRLVEHTEWLHARTREAALEKLDRLAIYVLEVPPPSPQEVADPKEEDAGYAGTLAAWLQQKADAQWRLLDQQRVLAATVGKHERLTLYDRMAREQLEAQWFAEVNYEIVNAWYDPTRNTITIPPGILFPPIYRGRNDVADLASMGTIIGHEMGHSLDVSGRFFDSHGFYVMPEQADVPSIGWWRDHDIEGFEQHMQCLAAEFGHPCQRADYGMHTMGEEYLFFTHTFYAHRLVWLINSASWPPTRSRMTGLVSTSRPSRRSSNSMPTSGART